MSLKHYEFWLQDTQMLESHKNLVDQCVQGEGLVQINVQVQTSRRRINIADVLKPTDDVLESYQQELQLAAAQAAAAAAAASISGPNAEATTSSASPVNTAAAGSASPTPATTTVDTAVSSPAKLSSKEEQETASAVAAIISSANAEANAEKVAAQTPSAVVTNGSSPAKVAKMSPPDLADSPTIIDDDDDEDEMGDGGQAALRWVCDTNFKRDQQRLNIPDDPIEWTVAQVKHWIQWAVRTFQLTSIKLADWSISGRELCDMDHAEFKQKVPSDPGDLFWTHMELLRKCKFVAVVQKHGGLGPASGGGGGGGGGGVDPYDDDMVILRKVPRNNSMGSEPSYCGNRSGNNGQIQLWQFLLEILTDKEHRGIIQWMGENFR